MNEWYGRHYDNMRNRLQKANEVLKNKKEFSKYDSETLQASLMMKPTEWRNHNI